MPAVHQLPQPAGVLGLILAAELNSTSPPSESPAQLAKQAALGTGRPARVGHGQSTLAADQGKRPPDFAPELDTLRQSRWYRASTAAGARRNTTAELLPPGS